MAFVTSINLIAGGDPVHITVTDQNGNPVGPSGISWDILPNAFVSAAPDSTGFNFSATNQEGWETISVTATYNGPGVNVPLVGPRLTVNVALPAPPPVTVTSLQYTSP